MSITNLTRFISPYDDLTPDGAAGWEELYPYYLRFREDRREFEESRFWFADLQNWPTVFKPFDTITVEFAIKCLGQYNTRHLLIPPANGIDYRVHNGYVYMTPSRCPRIRSRLACPSSPNGPATTSPIGESSCRAGRRRSAGSSLTSRRLPLNRCPRPLRSSGSPRGAGSTRPSRWRQPMTARSNSATRHGSTTASFSTSATWRTSTSSPSARRRYPASPTSASPRWSRGSTSSCSDRTRSCGGWPDSPLSLTSLMPAGAGFWGEADDIFYVRRDELQQAMFDYGNGWAVGVESMGPYYSPREIARRKKIIAALELKAAPPAMNEPPAVVTEPFTIMLYGITSEAVSGWLSTSRDTAALSGMGASPGVVEGIARVVGGAEALGDVQEGEILVTRITAPSWGPVFGRIAAAVTDIGGMLSHAAIVCREYGLPAVTGVGSATTTIRTGQRLRVDGNTGRVSILS